ncbi:hypothetical protein EV05_0684 [Prochlorococcus sp. MIT 0601]|nr:hypothetical protein EV05_0684 [Prochlorococcus sp. MIT 0601]
MLICRDAIQASSRDAFSVIGNWQMAIKTKAALIQEDGMP